MQPEIIAAALAGITIIAFAGVKIAGIFARHLPSGDLAGRLESLEHQVDTLQRALSETQERLDFTERVLAKARDEHRLP